MILFCEVDKTSFALYDHVSQNIDVRSPLPERQQA